MDKFSEIIQEAIAEAERVKCPMPEFRRGLRTMLEELEQRLELEDFSEDDEEEESNE